MHKRGKPFTKMASNDTSPRMTRENYFKIAESQGLSTMREEMISIMGKTADMANENLQGVRRSGFGGPNASFAFN